MDLDRLDLLADAFNRHDVEDIMAFFTADCVYDSPRGTGPGGTRFTGKEAVAEGIAARFAGLPDVHYGNVRHFVSDDRGVSEWRLTGTTPEGERIDVQGCDLWEFRGSSIARKDSYWKIVDP